VLYQSFEAVARARIAPRDLHDWPVVALALALNLPIWTEDQDFFGSGIATWRPTVSKFICGRDEKSVGQGNERTPSLIRHDERLGFVPHPNLRATRYSLLLLWRRLG